MLIRNFRSGRLAGAVAAGAVLIATGSIALAATDAASAISARQANFGDMREAMKDLRDQLDSGRPQKTPVVAAATTIASMARKQGALFPTGSGPGAGVDTDALPGIWSNKADFDQRMETLVAETDKLLAAANSGSISATQAQYQVVGMVCKGCHDTYRAD